MPTWPLELRTGILRPSGQTQVFSVYGPLSFCTESAKLSRKVFCCLASSCSGRKAQAALAARPSVSAMTMRKGHAFRSLEEAKAGDDSGLVTKPRHIWISQLSKPLRFYRHCGVGAALSAVAAHGVPPSRIVCNWRDGWHVAAMMPLSVHRLSGLLALLLAAATAAAGAAARPDAAAYLAS